MANAQEILSEIHQSLVGLEVQIRSYFRASPKARCALVIMSALLIGVIETLLALGFSVPLLSVGVVGAILPYVFASLITLAVTGIVGYALYRAMGGGVWQARVTNPWDVLSCVNLKSLPEAKEKKEAESFVLLQQVQKSCFANLEEGKAADYSIAFQSFGAMLTGLQSNPGEKADGQKKADDQLVSELRWQQQLLQICGKSSNQESQEELLSGVAEGINSHYSTGSLIFAANLAAVQDTRSQGMDEKVLTTSAIKITEQYKKLFSCIQKNDRHAALAVLRVLDPDPEVPKGSPWTFPSPFKKPKASLSSRPPPLPPKRKNLRRAQKKSVKSQV